MRFKIALAILFTTVFLNAHANKWQQRVEYEMEIDFDATKHQFKGKQKLVYYNNSPEELSQVFYHLYFNAFQPGSDMDLRSRTITDPDKRIGDRISELKPEEQGYHKILKLTQDGKEVKYKVVGTILQVWLDKPIKAGKKSVFEMEFESQVPVQIRRSGRDNAEGVAYSMSQWYPKMCEFDFMGWHANQYIAREFHGVWGDFDVKITIDKDYMIGGSGYLQNADAIGYGYTDKAVEYKTDKLTWHFKAPNVHDFAWAADKDYIHRTYQVTDGPLLHFIHKDDTAYNDNWEKAEPFIGQAFETMKELVGAYPYKQYTIIQGGDGGMEYPMATLITGKRSMGSVVGVSVHELIHSWFQGMLATNESLYPWMDEGFTSYYSSVVMRKIFPRKGHIHAGAYAGYIAMANSGKEEPLTTHADFYHTNSNYGNASYNKGEVFLAQLKYIVGDEAFKQGMQNYFNEWKFRHPDVNDFKRVMEKAASINLSWYVEQWVQTTNQIDYAIKTVIGDAEKTTIIIKREGDIMMPIEVTVVTKKDKKQVYYIPLTIMYGSKQVKDIYNWNELPAWQWTNENYKFTIDIPATDIKEVVVDIDENMADVDRDNNGVEMGE